jgi:ribosomal protein S18 acetylase RimI-like enzyme
VTGPLIRDARPEDADDVARLMGTVGTTIPPGDDRARSGLEDFMAEGGTVLVAEEGGRVVAACTLLVTRFNPMDATPGAWLDGLAVEEGHRRRGIARALMREARRRAEAEGCDAIVLHTHEEQEAALALYEQLGLRRHGLILTWPMRRP